MDFKLDIKVGTKVLRHYRYFRPARNSKAIAVNPVIQLLRYPLVRQIRSKVPPTFATDVGPILAPVGPDTADIREER